MPGGFVDEVRIDVRGGSGGHGIVAFQREKYKPKGGPGGGDGGDGGSVVLVADEGKGSLVDYRHRHTHYARSGETGGRNNRTGADADDLELPVPVGTMVRDAQTGELLADLAKPGARFIVGRGGRGGRGNASLARPTDRAPNFAEGGEPGEQRSLLLELRLVADIGLLGPPNAGKSTLLRAISRATPRVGEYPFTTIDPNLGVVEAGDERFVVADLPGLIEGAAEGRGLGTRFLRHAERCGVLAVVVDLSSPDPEGDLETVVREAEAHDRVLGERVRLIVGNKIDLEEASAEGVRRWAEVRGARFVGVSALEHANVEAFIEMAASEVRRAWDERGEPESFAVFRPVDADPILVSREGEGFRVQSTRVERLVQMTPLGNQRALRRLQRRLKSLGVDAALRREGAQEGDEVFIGDAAFEYSEDG